MIRIRRLVISLKKDGAEVLQRQTLSFAGSIGQTKSKHMGPSYRTKKKPLRCFASGESAPGEQQKVLHGLLLKQSALLPEQSALLLKESAPQPKTVHNSSLSGTVSVTFLPVPLPNNRGVSHLNKAWRINELSRGSCGLQNSCKQLAITMYCSC